MDASGPFHFAEVLPKSIHYSSALVCMEVFQNSRVECCKRFAHLLFGRQLQLMPVKVVNGVRAYTKKR